MNRIIYLLLFAIALKGCANTRPSVNCGVPITVEPKPTAQAEPDALAGDVASDQSTQFPPVDGSPMGPGPYDPTLESSEEPPAVRGPASTDGDEPEESTWEPERCSDAWSVVNDAAPKLELDCNNGKASKSQGLPAKAALAANGVVYGYFIHPVSKQGWQAILVVSDLGKAFFLQGANGDTNYEGAVVLRIGTRQVNLLANVAASLGLWALPTNVPICPCCDLIDTQFFLARAGRGLSTSSCGYVAKRDPRGKQLLEFQLRLRGLLGKKMNDNELVQLCTGGCKPVGLRAAVRELQSHTRVLPENDPRRVQIEAWLELVNAKLR